MEAHAFVQFCKPGGERRGDEVDCVTALGQLFSQLGADDAASTVGWINRDADIHKTVSSMQ
jgi:hypothetical protein